MQWNCGIPFFAPLEKYTGEPYKIIVETYGVWLLVT